MGIVATALIWGFSLSVAFLIGAFWAGAPRG